MAWAFKSASKDPRFSEDKYVLKSVREHIPVGWILHIRYLVLRSFAPLRRDTSL